MLFEVLQSLDGSAFAPIGEPSSALSSALQHAEARARSLMTATEGRPSTFYLAVRVRDAEEYLCTLHGSGLRADWRMIDRAPVHAEPEAEREATVDDAMRILRRAHATTVRDFATDALAMVASGEHGNRAELDRHLEESIDGCQEVIYTYRAKLVLLVSEHEDAMQKELGETGTVEQRAYFALLADVREDLEHATGDLSPEDQAKLGDSFDVDDDSTYPAQQAEQEEAPEDFHATAARWHGGQWTCLYAFCSSGTVTIGLGDEIASCLKMETADDSNERECLEALAAHVAPLESALTADGDA